MKDLKTESIEKLRQIAEPGSSCPVAPEMAVFLGLETWDTEETVGKEGEDGQ